MSQNKSLYKHMEISNQEMKDIHHQKSIIDKNLKKWIKSYSAD